MTTSRPLVQINFLVDTPEEADAVVAEAKAELGDDYVQSFIRYGESDE